MRRVLSFALALTLLLSGCAVVPGQPEKKQYNATFLDLFDTVTTVVGKAESEEAFRQTAQQVHDALLTYHEQFDIYHDYPGVANLKTVNDAAGQAPVTVDKPILDLLLDCKLFYEATGGKVNVAMGSVLKLWHDARQAGVNDPANAKLPEPSALQEAAEHTDINALVIDREASSVYLSDPKMRLDVGAVAKGWAAQKVAQEAPEGLLISVGGNVCATGPKDEGGTPWVVGIQAPRNTESYLHTLHITSGSVVTSGDYQRTYVVNGEAYHHIIDPDTLYPARMWSSVSVVGPDSGTADALSTALFLLPREQGQALLDLYGAEAVWVTAGGECFYSPGFAKLIRT